MNSFKTYAKEFEILIQCIVTSERHHPKWLNTLSYLENCGARKIANCEHPIMVEEEMLKHAAEEFRHAHYLKRQIKRLTSQPIPSYSMNYILGGISSWHYLRALDYLTSRYLIHTVGLARASLKGLAYHLVTYMIEVRAKELYQIYDEILRKNHSKVTVKSILLEEEGHLAEMESYLCQVPEGALYINAISSIEATLCEKWLHALFADVEKNPAL
ncbi:MAG: hypothetical protein CK425_09225 [Parachlamydia sp.]|nr:MAG: hypothetical protein CK425_09225 [Parachlamydia sp.]